MMPCTKYFCRNGYTHRIGVMVTISAAAFMVRELKERIKFITGDRDLAEWDDFVAEVNKLGDIDKVLSYYNGGKQFPMGERRYPALPPDLR